MLTLFLMLGTAYLVAASRARESADAIARKVLFNDQTNYRPETYLDNVLMKIVRGGGAVSELTDGGSNSGEVPVFESLLHDRYDSGNTISGTVASPNLHSAVASPVVPTTSVPDPSGPVITLDFSGPSVHPALLNGRILTLIRNGRPSTSYRIIRASAISASTYALVVTNPRGPHQWTHSTINNFNGDVIINGREFAGTGAGPNEAWDGFDSFNAFLAQVEPSTSQVSQTDVIRPSFLSTWPPTSADSDADGITDTIDNDGDGVDDGVFLNWGLPSLPTANGTINLHASALIVDLDGRFNVNAHGSLANMPIRVTGASQSESIYASSNPGWPRDSTGTVTDRNTIQVDLELVPLGSGIGPAEVNADHMFSTAAMNATATSGHNGEPENDEQIAGLFTTGGHSVDAAHGRRAATGRFTTNAVSPQVGAIEGRYGGKGANQLQMSNNVSPGPGGTDQRNPINLSTQDDFSLPGAPNGTLTGEQVGDTIMSAYGVPADWWNSTTDSFSSPPDVLGRMKFLTRPALDERGSGSDEDGDSRIGTFGLVPRPTYAKAEWADERMLSPYNFRLTSIGTRGGKLHAASTSGTTLPTGLTQPTENPFALSELESLLRPYDVDSSKLPMRLQAMLGTVAEQMRTRLTTESWDTTAIVDGSAGGAWQTIQNAITSLPLPTNSTLYNSSPVLGAFGGEISRGEKFNLNRPMTNTKPAAYNPNNIYYMQRQAYFKDLYTLLVLLNPGASLAVKEEYAQWAANVVEFRDADSTMTPFEYDTDLSNGWGCDGDVRTELTADRGDTVWGVERPEILITSGVGWEDSSGGGEIYIGLHRPWKSDALDTLGRQVSCKADDDFDTTGTDEIDLVKTPSVASYPIWRFRIESGGSSVEVPFQLPDSTELSAIGVSSPWNTSNAKLGTDDWLGVRMSVGVTPGSLSFDGHLLRDHDDDSSTPDRELELFRTDMAVGGSAITFPGSINAAGQDRTVTIHLERLDCPLHDGDANWSLPATDGYSGGTLSSLGDARYLPVDSMEIVLVNMEPVPPVPTLVTFADVASVENKRFVDHPANEEFWKRADPPVSASPPALNAMTTNQPPEYRGTSSVSASLGGSPSLGTLAATSPSNIAAYPWLNRPFNSPVELFLIPNDAPGDLLANYRTLLTSPGTHDVPNPLLLETVTVPTLFAGVHDSWADSSDLLRNQTGIDTGITPVNQLSSYREPGRVNLNTVTNDQTWDAVVAGPFPVEDVNRNGILDSGEDVDSDTVLDAHPVTDRKSVTGGPPAANLDTTPAQTMASVLEIGGLAPVRFDSNSTYYNAVDVDLNPQHKIYTASRLANTATVRSNLFAVWVTLRESISGDADSVKYHRAFYIIDRSIPVGFQAGQDHNVKDTIRLRRIIE